MDAFEIAQLMADQDPKTPLRMRYGTVSAISPGGALSISPDGQTASVPAVRCCNPSIGSRVVLLVNETEWLAVSVIGGDCQPAPRIGSLWTTSTDEDPSKIWPGTTWEQVKDRFILASGSRKAGINGGEETVTLTNQQVPSHYHRITTSGTIVGWSGNSPGWVCTFDRPGAWGDGYPNGEFDYKDRNAWGSPYIEPSGGGGSHNNLPPYETYNIWHRLS